MVKTTGFAVVTGASQGLGKAFAETLSATGWNLMLVALPGTGLPTFAEELSRFNGGRVLALELDLSEVDSQQKFLSFVLAEDSPIDLLVNNMGIGDNGLFDLIPIKLQRKAIDVNIQATLALTYGLVERLAASGGRILTVASLAAFYPMPLFAVYAASKSFLLHWSIALRHELAPLGISVTALTPGGIYTSEAIREKTKSQGLFGRLSSKEPAEIAAIALRGTFAGKAIVVPGVFNKILMIFGSRSPKNMTAKAIFKRWRGALGKVKGGQDCGWFRRVAAERQPHLVE
ncbi:MAG: SDR family NAD(P)-dependent oxidoreductase [Spirochaetales bacterium]|jgi:hypothetical protein